MSPHVCLEYPLVFVFVFTFYVHFYLYLYVICICCSSLYCLFVFVVPHCNVYCVFVVLHCIVYLYLLFHVVMCIVYAPRVLFMHGDALVCRQTTNDFDGNEHEHHLCFPSSSRKRMKFELFPKQGLLIILSYCHITAVSQDMNGCLSDPGMSSCRYISYICDIYHHRIIAIVMSLCHKT